MSTKRHAVECHGGGMAAGAPALAVFDICRAKAEEIVRLARLVRANRLDGVHRSDHAVIWLERDPRDVEASETGDDVPAGTSVDASEAAPEAVGQDLTWTDGDVMRSECDTLVVGDDSYWFTCYRRHCDDKIETASQSVAELATHFGLAFDGGAEFAADPSEGELGAFALLAFQALADWKPERLEAYGLKALFEEADRLSAAVPETPNPVATSRP